MREPPRGSVAHVALGFGALPAGLGYQDYGGRIMREPLRKL